MKHPIAPLGALMLAPLTVVLPSAGSSFAAEQNASSPDRWTFGDGVSTVWKIDGSQLPHSDRIEQGGRRVGQKVWHSINADGTLKLERDVVWPSLRIIPNDTHGSLIQHYGSEAEPQITLDAQPLGPLKILEIRLDGTLTFTG